MAVYLDVGAGFAQHQVALCRQHRMQGPMRCQAVIAVAQLERALHGAGQHGFAFVGEIESPPQHEDVERLA
ncbi:hypothetical protein D9M69_583950 [compost metagenome]